MKGYDVTVILSESMPPISRNLILPQKLTFEDLEKILLKSFSFKGYHSSDFRFENSNDVFSSDKTALIDKYITDTIYFNYDFGDDWLMIMFLNDIVDYDKNYATLTFYTGEYNPIEDCGGVQALNAIIYYKKRKIIKKSIVLRKFNPDNIQKALMKIKVYNYKAYDVKIRDEDSGDIWRDFLIPENTGFNEIENIIKITFDRDVSFDLDDNVDEYFKNNKKIFSNDYEFSLVVKKIVKYDKSTPTLKRFKGGNNPYDKWYEFYPDEKPDSYEDKNQSSLDDFF